MSTPTRSSAAWRRTSPWRRAVWCRTALKAAVDGALSGHWDTLGGEGLASVVQQCLALRNPDDAVRCAVAAACLRDHAAEQGDQVLARLLRECNASTGDTADDDLAACAKAAR